MSDGKVGKVGQTIHGYQCTRGCFHAYPDGHLPRMNARIPEGFEVVELGAGNYEIRKANPCEYWATIDRNTGKPIHLSFCPASEKA